MMRADPASGGAPGAEGGTACRDGNAVVYCEGAFTSTYGKTAHGLVRRTRRYRVAGVIDSTVAGRDAGEVLDGRPNGIPLLEDLPAALGFAGHAGFPATHFVIGIAPDGGRLSPAIRSAIVEAIERGLDVDSGLHDFLSDDPEISAAAGRCGVTLRDVRRTPPRAALHAFTGKIEEVTSFRVAILGTDSAIGKRTTAWSLVEGLEATGVRAEMLGTGQTAWMQGARYGVLLDSLINDFVAGEIEHAAWSAWKEADPQVIVLEGQGSLMNPAYPGGFELLAAGRPQAVVLQHAPSRLEYDGFPGYPLHPLETQIRAIELLSGRPVIAVTINHENLTSKGVAEAREKIETATGLPATDVLLDGPERLVGVVRQRMSEAGP
ncbi:MAG: DUF1611 domain-containing protein [Gemmatimonadales bacterium]|jgi:uncharacterized NAD-dependent epimerase/dehydratase family protein